MCFVEVVVKGVVTRYDEREPIGILSALHRVCIDLENAHWLRVHSAAIESGNLCAKLDKVFGDSEAEDVILVSFSAACGLSDGYHHRV